MKILICRIVTAMNSTRQKLNLTRREFLLQLIKEMCGFRSAKSDLLPLPTMVAESSSQTSRKRKQCQLQLCRNKSSVSCHKCLKSCCGRHTSSTVHLLLQLALLVQQKAHKILLLLFNLLRLLKMLIKNIQRSCEYIFDR